MFALGLLLAIASAFQGGVASPSGPGGAVTLTYFIADGRADAGFRASDRQLALWALDAWQRSAQNRFRIEPAPEADALVRVYWTEPNDGRYGEMQPLNVGGHRGAAVFIQADVALLDETIARPAATDDLMRETVVYLTCLHELGHALGLAHTSDFRDIMYYFGYGGDIVAYFNRYRSQLHTRADIASVPGLSVGDVTRLRAIFNSAH